MIPGKTPGVVDVVLVEGCHVGKPSPKAEQTGDGRGHRARECEFCGRENDRKWGKTLVIRPIDQYPLQDRIPVVAVQSTHEIDHFYSGF